MPLLTPKSKSRGKPLKKLGVLKRRCKTSSQPSGFTLIEIIVTILLLGIVATFGGFLLVNAVRSYTFAQDNAHLSQKAQVAMTRVMRELSRIQDGKATSTSPNSIEVTTCDDPAMTMNFERNGNELQLNGVALTDSVTSFNVTSNGNKPPYTIELVLTGENGANLPFKTSITPESCS
ncbi:PilW family protein [Desulfonatronum lacustre]|uniref:PilW family protein n=1 Tax=Desulfonatronum lacustre TaxID=66849 RepID=UPI00048C98A3|nr:prepilin-type N-terminal cleavage/methylation domain-containing protein [Desulfonatronum lacustre]